MSVARRTPAARELEPAASPVVTAGDETAIAEAPPETTAPAPPERIRWVRIGVFVAILALWELVLRTGLISPVFLASPSQIVIAGVELAADGEIRQAFAETLAMVAVAFGIAAIGGILLGAWLGLSNWAYRAFHPLVALAMSTPKMIFLPLMLVVFGIGFTAKVAYGAFSAIFYVTINVTAGARMVDPTLLTAIRSMGASRRDRLRLVVLPGSLPAVAVGLWYGMKHALLGVLIAELFVSIRGIGYWIGTYTASFRVDRVYAIVVALSAMAIALGSIWKRVDDRVGRWRPSA